MSRKLGAPRADFRNFQLEWNGERFEEIYFRSRDSGDEDWELGTLFGLDTKQCENTLFNEHDASSFYDLFPYKPELAKYIAFGDETGGGILPLELATGQIKLLAHDFQSEDRSLWIGEACSILYVANSFSDFRQKLLTEDEIDSDDFGQDWHDMEELRRERNLKLREEGRLRQLRRSTFVPPENPNG